MVRVSDSQYSANIFFLCLIHTHILIFVLIFFFLSILRGLVHMKSSGFFVFNILEGSVLFRFFLLLPIQL